MMVKNEAKTLAQCLNSIVGIADEIIIVDTGSTDGTQEIIKKYQKKEYYFEWNDDFAAARNYVASLARGKYICRWDADWILRNGDLEKILKLKNDRFDNVDEVHFNWVNEFEDETLEPTSSVTHMFLYKREFFEWYCPVPAHDMIRPLQSNYSVTKSVNSNIWVYHQKDPHDKQHRYDQTHSLIQQKLYTMSSNDENRIITLQFYLSSCMFREEFQEAKWIVEEMLDKLTPNNPIFYYLLEQHIQILTNLGKIEKAYIYAEKYYNKYPNFQTLLSFADISALLNLNSSINLYKKYLKLKLNQESININYERYEVHPLIMLGYITKDLNFLEKALIKTRKKSTKSKIITLKNS
jgi:glycosyltransferase involved in cell wall biosynthesis